MQAMVCDFITRQEVNKSKKDPYQLYQNIQKLFIPVLNAGSKYQIVSAWHNWDVYTDCAQELITSSDLQQDKNILVLAKYRMKKSRNLDPVTLKKTTRDLTNVYNNALDIINDEVEKPLNWKSAVLAESAQSIFPHYKTTLLQSYEDLKKKSLVDSKQIVDLVKKVERISSGDNEQQAINTIADKIEKLIYVLAADKKRVWFGKTVLQKEINELEEIFNALNEHYIIETSLMREKISLSTNTEVLIILAEAKALIDLGKKLKESINYRR